MLIVRIFVTLLFIFVSVWGLYGQDGQTLSVVVSKYLGISFRKAAFLVSALSAFLGSLSLLLWVVDHHANRKKQESQLTRDNTAQ